MQDQPSQLLGECDPRIERAIILQFLRDDYGDRWSRAELEVEISNVESLDISDAIARLDQDGIVQMQTALSLIPRVGNDELLITIK